MVVALGLWSPLPVRSLFVRPHAGAAGAAAGTAAAAAAAAAAALAPSSLVWHHLPIWLHLAPLISFRIIWRL